ncbi:MAG: hypothetical protein M0Z34_03895 [Nitrospiraceae bacterium]|nr:hypothetical protein [Nitrospiraceae bacterium]
MPVKPPAGMRGWDSISNTVVSPTNVLAIAFTPLTSPEELE